MPKRIRYEKAEALAKKYSTEYIEDLLRADPGGMERLWQMIHGKLKRHPKHRKPPKKQAQVA